MLNQALNKDYADVNKNNQLKLLDVKWSTLSESTISNVQTIVFRKIRSENQIESNVNYDDLCGPWVYSVNPFYNRYVEPPNPSLCIWKYFTEEDVIYLRKHQENKDAICTFFENKLSNATAGTNNTVFTNLLWEFFKFARLNLFTEKSMSACLGIVYLTHTFFLSYPWLTAKQVHEFFYKTVLLHVILVCIVFFIKQFVRYMFHKCIRI